jgi:hypothetical protein
MVVSGGGGGDANILGTATRKCKNNEMSFRAELVEYRDHVQ